MEVNLPVRIVRDHQGNILHCEYRRTTLTPEQVNVVCALLAKLIDSDGEGAVNL